MNLRALLPIALLSLVVGCAAETADDGPHTAQSSALMTNGGKIPCHFTVAGCAGEGPDGFSQDPDSQGGGGGGGGGYEVPADPGGARAYAQCANQCISSNALIGQSYGACQLACLQTGARGVHHVPGVGFVGDGSPYDPTNIGVCESGCSVQETLCIDACAGGVF